MLKTDNLTKEFSNGEVTTRALKNISCSIGSGEFVAITGRSGAGKSTLLYQLGLLDLLTTGTVTIDNKDVSSISEFERSRIRLDMFGFVFQDYALVPELTAVENVMIPLLMRGDSLEQANLRSTEVLTDLGLGERLHFQPSRLSGGQQQRVSIARALAGKPKILCADEPTANLDSENGMHVIELLKTINKEGTTILLVTHEDEYIHYANHVIHLSDGEITADTLK